MIPPRRFLLVFAFSVALHLFVIVPLLVAGLRENAGAHNAEETLRPILVRVISGPGQKSAAPQVGVVPRSSGAPNHARISSPAVARRRGERDREPRRPRTHHRRVRQFPHPANVSSETPTERPGDAPSPVNALPQTRSHNTTPSQAVPLAPVARPRSRMAPQLSMTAKTRDSNGARFARGISPAPRPEQAVSSSPSGTRPAQRATLPDSDGARKYTAPVPDGGANPDGGDDEAAREAREREARLQGEREAAAREAAEREAAQREQRLGEERARLNRERQEQERQDRERQEREKREKEDRERAAREKAEREKAERERQARESREREQREREQREREAREAARPKGPTRDAEILSDPRPDISEDMSEDAARRSVTVRFRISSSGDASASLVRSSGSAAIDARVLAACNRWRFRPALRNGEPYASTLRLRVDF